MSRYAAEPQGTGFSVSAPVVPLKGITAAPSSAPRVSVLMPVYNSERVVGDAIESILAQTYTDFEFVIIDDGSTDGTRDVIREYSDPRILLLCNARNMGVAGSLNRGLGICKGELIARQDADDVSLPDRLSTQVAYLDTHQDVGLVGTGYYLASPAGTSRNKPRPSDDISIKWKLLFGNQFTATSVIFRRRLATELGGFANDPVTQDYALWSLMADHTQLANLDQPLVCYRPSDTSITVKWPDRVWNSATEISASNIRRLVGNKLSERNLRVLQLLMTGTTRRENPEALARTLLAREDGIKSAAAQLITAFAEANGLTRPQRRALQRQVYLDLARRILSFLTAQNERLTRAVRLRLYTKALSFSTGLLSEAGALRTTGQVVLGSRNSTPRKGRYSATLTTD